MLINEITRRGILKGAGAASLVAADPTGSLVKIANNLVQTAPASKQEILAELLGNIDIRDLYQIWLGYGEYVTTADFITPKEEDKLEKLYGRDWWEILHDKTYAENKDQISVVQDMLQEPTTFSQVSDILRKHGLNTKNWEQIRDWFFDDKIDKQFFDLYKEYQKDQYEKQAAQQDIDTTSKTAQTHPIEVPTQPVDHLTPDIANKLNKLKGRVQAAAKRAIQTFLTRGLSNKLSKKQMTDIASGNFDIKKISPQQIPTLHQLEYKPEVYNQWLDKLENNPTVYDPIVIDDRNNVLAGSEQLEALKILDLTAEVYVVPYSKDTEK